MWCGGTTADGPIQRACLAILPTSVRPFLPPLPRLHSLAFWTPPSPHRRSPARTHAHTCTYTHAHTHTLFLSLSLLQVSCTDAHMNTEKHLRVRQRWVEESKTQARAPTAFLQRCYSVPAAWLQRTYTCAICLSPAACLRASSTTTDAPPPLCVRTHGRPHPSPPFTSRRSCRCSLLPAPVMPPIPTDAAGRDANDTRGRRERQQRRRRGRSGRRRRGERREGWGRRS